MLNDVDLVLRSVIFTFMPGTYQFERKEAKISADADGGPRSRVCSCDTPAQPPIDMN